MKKDSGNTRRGFLDFSIMTGSEFFWGILILVALITILKGYLGTNSVGTPELGGYYEKVKALYAGIEPYVKIASYILSALFVFGIAYSVRERNKIYAIMTAAKYPKAGQAPVDMYANKKWERVQSHMASQNESDWKLAILEADIMLDELLDVSGYKGDTMGEKLKQVDKSDFNTIDMAWEAHKVRNMIAHEGSDFAMSEREARRVVGLYEAVFKEFRYI